MADNAAEYIKHHLTNLTYGEKPDGTWGIAHSAEEAAAMGFNSVNLDSMFWSVLLGLVTFRLIIHKKTEKFGFRCKTRA